MRCRPACFRGSRSPCPGTPSARGGSTNNRPRGGPCNRYRPCTSPPGCGSSSQKPTRSCSVQRLASNTRPPRSPRRYGNCQSSMCFRRKNSGCRDIRSRGGLPSACGRRAGWFLTARLARDSIETPAAASKRCAGLNHGNDALFGPLRGVCTRDPPTDASCRPHIAPSAAPASRVQLRRATLRPT
jgi:hypothetical protein